MIKIENVSRRTFLKASAALGGSFALGLFLEPLTKLHPFYGKYLGVGSAEAAEGVPAAAGTLSPNLFVSIDKTGTVTIVAHRSEMGQGVRTSVPMILADELEADWSRVKIEQAPGDKMYGNQYTDGSRSVRHNFERMREFGASHAHHARAGRRHPMGRERHGVQGAEPQGGARADRPLARLRPAGGDRRRPQGPQRSSRSRSRTRRTSATSASR